MSAIQSNAPANPAQSNAPANPAQSNAPANPTQSNVPANPTQQADSYVSWQEFFSCHATCNAAILACEGPQEQEV